MGPVRLTGLLRLTLAAFVLAAGPLAPLPARAAELETSVVQLVINEQAVSDSFELLDTGETVLLPLRGLSRWLDGRVELNPQAKTARLTRTWDQAVGEVDLHLQRLTLGGREDPLLPGGTAGAGDFFLPLPAVERLFDVRVTWDAQIQTLLVTADRELTLFRKDEKKENAVAGEQERKPDRAPFLTLGAIQYVLTYAKTSDEDRWPRRDELKLDLHLQAGGVPLDLSGKAENVSGPDPTWNLDRATVTYYGRDALVIAGDTTFDLGRVVRNASLRGLRYSSPPGWTSAQVEASTVVEGWVAPGSTVELSANGYFLGRVVTEDGHYVFERVPLQITKANTLTITVTGESGQRTTETRTVTATPRLLPTGKVNVAFGAGWIREGSSSDWSSFVEGASAYTGVTPALTVGAEMARRRELGPDQHPVSEGDLAGNVGLALRLRDNLVGSLDWMLSGPTDEPVRRPDQGVDLATLLQTGRTAWQGVVFYHEPALKLFSRTVTPDLKGYRLLAEHTFSDFLALQLSYEKSQPVSDGVTAPRVELGSVLHWVPAERQSLVLSGERTPGEGHQVDLDYELGSPTTNVQLQLSGDWEEQDGSVARLSNADGALTFSRALSRQVLFGLSRSDDASWSESELSLHSHATEAELAWFPGKYRIAASGGVKGVEPSPGPADSSRQETLGLDVSRSFNLVTLGAGAEDTRDYEAALTDHCVTDRVYLRTKSGKGWAGLLQLDHLRPLLGAGYVETLRAKAMLSTVSRNGLQLALEGRAERRYGAGHSFADDYWVGLTLSQGLGFTGDGIRGFRAEDGRPMSYVIGTVFLDADRNGRRDEGERGLAGIPVILGGRRALTDNRGRYVFEFVEPGICSLGLDPEALPADYTPTTQPKLFQLPPNANYCQDFGVSLNGTIEGTVFVDYDHDGKPSANEPRYPWVRLLLDGKAEAFTDERGEFSFDNADLGRHTLTVDANSLPAGVLAPPAVTCEIAEGALDVWGILLPLGQQAPR